MEPSKEPISVRIGKLNAQIVGKSKSSHRIITRESLFDALQVLYDECDNDCIKNLDRNVSAFVEENKKFISDIKRMRVNILDFELRNVIGRGYFGEVHMVKEKQTGDVYAMKIIKKHQSLEERNVGFYEERNIMAFSESQWITKLQYAFQDSANLYFIMEYHPGGDLLGLLYRQGGTLPESAACFYIAELIMAINDLHKMGYIHRDVKPDNVLLDRCGHLKLADFGSAAKLDGKKCNTIPVGTPDYIAPEVLQSINGDNSNVSTYGISCDYWSLGVVAYELVVGTTPFNASTTASVYAKIMNHSQHLQFPNDIILSQGYISLIKELIREDTKRLVYPKIINHPTFKSIDFNNLRSQVPPFVPKITSIEDTSNFSDIQTKKNQPHIENFKRKTQFSGRNLPFIGFTFVQDTSAFKERYSTTNIRDTIVDNLKAEMDNLNKQLSKCKDWQQEKDSMQKTVDDTKRRLSNIESVRHSLEKDVAKYLAEISALKRTLEIERKDRYELERQALDLIKSAKLKWEAAEKQKLASLNTELEEQKERNSQLVEQNKSLKEELKLYKQLENTHKTSLEKVEQINRKSVVGLETRLEKVQCDSEHQIATLQEDLKREQLISKELESKAIQLSNEKEQLQDKFNITEECNRKSQEQIVHLKTSIRILKEEILFLTSKQTSLRNDKSNLEDTVNALNKELIDLKHDKKDLQSNLNKEQEIQMKLKQQVVQLNADIDHYKRNFDTESKSQEENLTKLQEEIKAIKDRNAILECKLQEAQQNDEENQIKVKNLEELLKRLENGLTKLESSSEREDVLQEQIQRLERQLVEFHESNALNKQETLKIKSSLWKCEKDLVNSNLDKKIVERDLVEAKNENKSLREQLNNLNQQLNDLQMKHQQAFVELNDLNENMANEIMRLKDLNNHLKNELNSKTKRQEQDENVATKLKEELIKKDVEINELKLEMERVEKDKLIVIRLIEQKEDNLRQLNDELNKINEARKIDIIARENCKIDLEKANESLRKLKEACSILDNQLIEFEKLKVEYDANEATFNYKIEQLTVELDQIKLKLIEAKKMTNEEKSLKYVAETKYKRLLEENESLTNDVKTYKEEIKEYKTYTNRLSEELNATEEKLAETEGVLITKQRNIDNYIGENKVLKEEISIHLTHISDLKESAYNLNQNLLDVKRDHEVLMEKFQELENTYFDKMNYFAERELKLNSTIQQQTKLIDFLQLKVEENNKKKKTLSDKLFGQSKKENVAPLSLNYKDLENELKKEKQISTGLREELYKLKSLSLPECRDSKLLKDDKKILEQIQSPNNKTELPRQRSLQRMRHKIPHRFESRINSRITKCTHCNNAIYLGKSCSICQECNVIVHTTCANLIPKTCGLPHAYAEHFSNVIKNCASKQSEEACTKFDNIEGWIKILSLESRAWEKRYVRLVGTMLEIFDKKPHENLKPIEVFDLLPENGRGKIILEPSVTEIEVPIASSDLNFIFKVEVHLNSWPSKCLTLMALHSDDKEKWFKALDFVIKGTQKYTGQTLLHLKEIDVNCVLDFYESIILLGTDKGLYSYHDDSLVHVIGIGSVHQIGIISNLNLALMIVNTNRILIRCDLNHLRDVSKCAPCTNPSLNFVNVNVNNLNGFHIFESSVRSGKELIVSVATSKQVIILNYDVIGNSFKPLRILDTAEPTSCLLFTEHSLIIGTDKFFEVDLNTFKADELLDVTDPKLLQAVVSSNLGSFPLDIVQISNNPIEYLVCFKEFATFIDEYGCSTRDDDLKWSQFPLAFHYNNPYLYVVTFVSIEIVKIDDKRNEIIFKNNYGSNLRYLGKSKRGIYIKTGDEIKLLEAKTIDFDNNNSFSTNSNEDNQEEDRFSFTSSMVNSLDGEEEGPETKRVQFTNL